MDIDSRLEMSLDEIISDPNSAASAAINGKANALNAGRNNRSRNPKRKAGATSSSNTTGASRSYPPSSRRRVAPREKSYQSDNVPDCGLKFLLPNYLTGSLIGSR